MLKNRHDVEVNSYTAVPPEGSSVTDQAFSQYTVHSPKRYVVRGLRRLSGLREFRYIASQL